MKITKIKYFIFIISTVIITNSCWNIRFPKKYTTRGWYSGGELVLEKNGTFSANFGLRGHSFGFWTKVKDTLIFNSQYDRCCIYDVNIMKSLTDTSQYIVFLFNLKNNEFHEETGFSLGNDTFSKKYMAPGDGLHKFKKEKTFKYFKIIKPTYRDTIHFALSKTIKFETADTITVTYDYVGDARNYVFFKNKKYLILKSKDYVKKSIIRKIKYLYPLDDVDPN